MGVLLVSFSEISMPPAKQNAIVKKKRQAPSNAIMKNTAPATKHIAERTFSIYEFYLPITIFVKFQLYYRQKVLTLPQISD